MSRSPNASQWSKRAMIFLKPRPASQPMTGISIWKNPKKKAMRRAGRNSIFITAQPLAMATASASMDNPKAKKNIVSRSI
jgi:hypothetical protein